MIVEQENGKFFLVFAVQMWWTWPVINGFHQACTWEYNERDILGFILFGAVAHELNSVHYIFSSSEMVQKEMYWLRYLHETHDTNFQLIIWWPVVNLVVTAVFPYRSGIEWVKKGNRNEILPLMDTHRQEYLLTVLYDILVYKYLYS